MKTDMKFARFFPVSLAICMALPLKAATITATNDGVRIDAGTFGAFTLGYPVLDLGQGEPLKPIEKTAGGSHASVKYAGGANLEVTVAPEGSISYAFSNPPAGFKTYRMDMLVDFGFNEGGTWRMGDGGAKPFPKEKPVNFHLYQGNSSNFVLSNFEGKTMAFVIPPYSYQELNDNREWRWKIYNWAFIAPFDRNNSQGVVKVLDQTQEGTRVIVADRFGQDAAQDFPGKVKTDKDLPGDVARDEVYYGALHPPARDTYGGLPGSGTQLGLRRTGYFHVEKKGEKWWLVDPEGNACFHAGICGFAPGEDYTYTKGREQIYEWLPAYESEYKPAFHPEPYWSRDAFSFYIANLIRKYGKYDSEALQARMVDRVRKFGFNSAGAFTGDYPARRALKFPWVPMLPLGVGSVGGGIEGLRGLFDPFDPAVATRMDEVFAREVAARANDPLLVGYFLDNEQAFEDIPRVIPALTGGQPAKQRLVAMLEAKYRTIAAFNAAWGLNAASFDGARNSGMPVTSRAAAADVDAFTVKFIEAYYKLVRDTFRKYDKNHMLLGNRWQPGTANNEQLCRIAGKYCEMLSLNYYTYGVDKGYLKRLYDWSGGRPFMLSEFYWASPAGSGLPGGSEVKTQHERGLAYRNYIEQAGSTGFVVGIEWFTLIDQARTGRWFERFNGEKANTGLFSVADRPYKDFLAEASAANFGIYDVLLGKRAPFEWADPRFQPKGAGTKAVSVPRAVGGISLDGTRKGWPGNPPETVPSSRIVIGADGTGFDGTFRLCWDDSNLYVMVQVSDPTPMRNDQQMDGIWNGDGVELFVGAEEMDKTGPLLFSDRQILLSAGKLADGVHSFIAHAPKQVACKVFVTPNVNGKGYVIEAAIPFEALGFTPRDGHTIRFDLGIDDGSGSGRQRQLMWSGGARNSGDRTDWGRVKFMK